MDSIETRIQYQFANPALLTEALTHASIRYESRAEVIDNQRLEFLGDAVLQLVLSEVLFRQFPDSDEGVLTKLRTRLVSTKALCTMARQLQLGTFLILGKAEESNGGRERESALADALEAVIGAVYLDGGLTSAQHFVLHLMDEELKALIKQPDDVNPKGELQELLQGLSSEAPTYEILASSGPDHKKQFDAAVLWRGKQIGHGRGLRKKDAEADAARDALVNPELANLLRGMGKA